VSEYPFLSPEWIEAVAAIRDEYRDRVSPPSVGLRANVTVTEAPFAEPTVKGHLDSTGGALTVDVGHLAEADFAIEVRYEVAYQIFVERDPQSILPILLGGQIKLTGDSSKVLGLASAATPPDATTEEGRLAVEVIHRIDAVTLHPGD
jgi:hypothetical protein